VIELKGKSHTNFWYLQVIFIKLGLYILQYLS